MNKYLSLIAFIMLAAIISCSNVMAKKEPTTKKDDVSVVVANEAPAVKITVEGKSYTFKLDNNKTTQELLKSLPVEGSAGIYHDNHYYLPLSKALPTDGLKATKSAKKGHLVYSSEFKGLGIFFGDGEFDENELFYIGKTDDDVSAMQGKNPANIKVEIIE